MLVSSLDIAQRFPCIRSSRVASQTVGIRDRRQGGSANGNVGRPPVELCPLVTPGSCDGAHWRPQGGGGTGAMAPPLAREGGDILPTGPTIDVKGKR